MYAPATPEEVQQPAPEGMTNLQLIRAIKAARSTLQTTNDFTIASEAARTLQELYDEAASRRTASR